MQSTISRWRARTNWTSLESTKTSSSETMGVGVEAMARTTLEGVASTGTTPYMRATLPCTVRRTSGGMSMPARATTSEPL